MALSSKMNGPPSFFKIISSKDDLQDGKSEIPRSAVRMYGDRLGVTGCLELPNGAVWPIGLTRCNGSVWLQKGWSKFAEFYSLAYGYILMFSYGGDRSQFQVRIFMRTPIEIDYFRPSGNIEDSLSGEIDYSGSAESPAFPVKAPSFFKLVLAKTIQQGKLEIPKIALLRYAEDMANTLFLEVPDGSVSPVKLIRISDSEIWLGKGWPEFARFYSLEDGCLLVFSYEEKYSHFKVRIFRKNGLEMDYSNQRGGAEGHRMKHMQQRTRGVVDRGMSAANRSSEFHSRTAKEVEDFNDEAYAKAGTFESENPFVVVKMQPSYLSHHLKIPVSFATKHICSFGDCKVNLQTSEKQTWSVKCIVTAYNHTTARFHDHGWRVFARDNRLEIGDACVFELIDQAPTITLKVHIFRARTLMPLIAVQALGL